MAALVPRVVPPAPMRFRPVIRGAPAGAPPTATSASGRGPRLRRVLFGLVNALAPVALHAPQRDAALRLLLEHELRVARRARLRHGLVPRDEVALLLRPVRAAVERLAAPRPLLGDEAAAPRPRAL